jgi:dihydroxyacid dehydratase/phosphogluconate dehydratase
MLAGGLPMELPIISLHESFPHPTSMFLRNLMSMDTEELIRAQPMDAVVLVGGCDKTVPALLMGVPPVRACRVHHVRDRPYAHGQPSRRKTGCMHRLPTHVGNA